MRGGGARTGGWAWAWACTCACACAGLLCPRKALAFVAAAKHLHTHPHPHPHPHPLHLIQPRQTEYRSKDEYLACLEAAAVLPKGFKVGTTRFEFVNAQVNKSYNMTLTLIALDKPTTSFAAKFTRNRFPGAPVLVGKSRMGGSLQAVIVNNKISNVGPSGVGDKGVSDTERVCESLARALSLPSPSLVFPSSTGVIGWRLPVEDMSAAMPSVVASLQSNSIFPAARGIMTTDRFPKVRSYTSPQGWKIVGICKGAGMIEPNMATMLAYILTDFKTEQQALSRALDFAVGSSFNCVSVDGDQSTSDTVLCLASCLVDAPGSEEEFNQALVDVCQSLAQDMVRNGEGTQHVVKCRVRGAPTTDMARGIGRAVLNSPLVKCAICGNDPNVGRIVAAIGSYLEKHDVQHQVDLDRASVTLGGELVFSHGQFRLNAQKEDILYQHLQQAQMFPAEVPEHLRDFPPHQRCAELEVDLFSGSCSVVTYGSDLTREYVDVNADYRS